MLPISSSSLQTWQLEVFCFESVHALALAFQDGTVHFRSKVAPLFSAENLKHKSNKLQTNAEVVTDFVLKLMSLTLEAPKL